MTNARFLVVLMAGVLLLCACNRGEQAKLDTEPEDDGPLVVDPEEPEPPSEAPDPCDVDELDHDVVFFDLEAGYDIGSPHTVTGCSSARELRWELLVDGEPIAAGSSGVEGDGRQGTFEFTLEFDDDVHLGDEAVLEVTDRAGETEPTSVEDLTVIGTVDVGEEDP